MFGKMMNSFYYGKSGKGDFRKEDLPTNRWQLFWEMLRVRISGLVRLNVITMIAWLPLIIVIGSCISNILNAVITFSDYNTYLATGEMGNLTEEMIAQLATIDSMENFLLATTLQALSNLAVFLIPAIAITGPVQAGMAYVTRNWARDEHAFVWADFKDALKENWKQGLGVSLISGLVPIMTVVCYRFYGEKAAESAFFLVPQMVTVILAFVWYLGTAFMYPLMVHYNMKFGAVVKNGIMMAIARLPQTVGLRILMLFPIAIAGTVLYFTGHLLSLVVLAGYYLFLGYALSRFVYASFTNAVFDKFINSHMEGVQINRGLASEEDDDEEEAETESLPQ